jgi:formylglycine-generating enzyme required for sulfatase activity
MKKVMRGGAGLTGTIVRFPSAYRLFAEITTENGYFDAGFRIGRRSKQPQVLRPGSWLIGRGGRYRCARRGHFDPNLQFGHYGFRIARRQR